MVFIIDEKVFWFSPCFRFVEFLKEYGIKYKMLSEEEWAEISNKRSYDQGLLQPLKLYKIKGEKHPYLFYFECDVIEKILRNRAIEFEVEER